MKAKPACSTFLANSAFSDRNPYLPQRGVFRCPQFLQEKIMWRNYAPWMNHIDTMLQGDTNNILLCEVCTNRSQPLPDLVRLIRLENAEHIAT